MSRSGGIATGIAVFFFALQAAAIGVAARINGPHPVGEPIEFAANGVGSGELTFTWDFGDGEKSEPSSSGTATHTYAKPGHYPVIVVVKDSTGARSQSFLQTVHRVLPSQRPEASSTIVHQPSEKRVCNVNADNDTVSCLSTDTLELLFEVEVGRHPRSLAVAPDGALWVVNQDDATITVLGVDGIARSTIELPSRSRPFGIVISAESGRAYVSLQALGELAELDVTSGELLRRTSVGPWPTGVAIDGAGSRIFVTRFISPSAHGEVAQVDAESFERTETFELALDPGPDSEATARGVPNYVRSAVVSPDGSALWVPSKKDNVLRGEARDGEALTFETSVRTIVSQVDLESNAEVLERRIDLNNRTLGLSLTFSSLGDYAFVGLLGNNGVEVLDAYDGRVVAGAFELGKAPDGLVLDDAGRLFVNSYLSRSIVILDAASVLASTSFELGVLAEVVVSSKEKLEATVLEGKRIFYDAADLRMTQDGYISCAVCHLDGFEDGRVWDFTDRGEGLRNTTSLLGKRGIGQGRLHWSANFDEVQDFEHDIRNAFGGTGFLSDEVFNEGTRNETLGAPKAGLSPELDALSAYVTSLDQVNSSPHRDSDGSLTEEGWRGLEVFRRAGCQECHGGPDFTDSTTGVVHDVGTLRETSGHRLGGALEGLDTPTLRGVWETAPYLHDGSAATLLDVVSVRNPDDEHGSTRDLSDDERADLVSYLLQIDNVALEDEVEPERAEDSPAARTAGDGGCSIQPGLGRPGAHRFEWAVMGLLGWLAFAVRRGARLRGEEAGRKSIGEEGTRTTMRHLSRSWERAVRSGIATACAFVLLACTAKLANEASDTTGGFGSVPGGTGASNGSGGSTSNQPPPPFEPHAGLLRRLTRAQFGSAVKTLLGVDVDVSELDPDSFDGDFSVIGATTVVTSDLGVERYHSTIETAVDSVFSDEQKRDAFVGCTPAAADDSCMKAFVESLGRRAWRRPLTATEVDRVMGVADTASTELESPVEGARWATVALLTSPHFLYRPELGEPSTDDGSMRLSGYEMASRLAFLLWNTLPDEELLDAAESGALSTGDGVRGAAERLLSVPAGREAASAFAEDYMRLDRVATQPKDLGSFPEYGPELQRGMIRDMREVWAIVAFDDDASVLDVFSTGVVVANAELARLYGLDDAGLDASTFKTFELPEGSPRAGILSKPGFLSQFANQKEGSPTLRGKFIREALMCGHVPAPPGNVALEIPETVGDGPSTKRQRLELHRTEKTCAGCHQYMDPLGLPLESFDAIGRYRTTEQGLTIDTSGDFDGAQVDDARELGVVMSSSKTIAECIVRKYYSYAVGYEARDVDEIVVQALAESFERSGYKLGNLIRDIVATEAFSTVIRQPTE